MRKNRIQTGCQNVSDKLTKKLQRLIGRKLEKMFGLSFLGTITIKELIKILAIGLPTQNWPTAAKRSCPAIEQ